MFRSSSFHTLDPKGRLIIPARFKETIEHKGGELVITNKDGCLYAFTLEAWAEIEKKLIAIKLEHMMRFKRFFLGNACQCTCDKQGRILIPPTLRSYAGLEKDVVLLGMVDRFEIWNREAWERENQLIDEDLKNPDVRGEVAALGL